jgi:hypothetical protein
LSLLEIADSCHTLFMESDLATVQCKNVEQALQLQALARGLGLNSTYFPIGGTDEAHDRPVVHTLGLQGEPAKVQDFLRKYQP